LARRIKRRRGQCVKKNVLKGERSGVSQEAGKAPQHRDWRKGPGRKKSAISSSEPNVQNGEEGPGQKTPAKAIVRVTSGNYAPTTSRVHQSGGGSKA